MASSEEDGTNGASEASDEKEATGKRRRLGFLATAWLTFYNIAMTAGYVRAKFLPRPAHALVRSLRGPGSGTRGARARSLAGLPGVEPRRRRRAYGGGTEARAGVLRGRGGGAPRRWGSLGSDSATAGQLGVAATLAHAERGWGLGESACARPLAIGALWARGRGAESKSARAGP